MTQEPGHDGFIEEERLTQQGLFAGSWLVNAFEQMVSEQRRIVGETRQHQ